jgi:hypothetical protein
MFFKRDLALHVVSPGILQITYSRFLEKARPDGDFKRNVSFQFPRLVFRRVADFARVVFDQTRAQIHCYADVEMI